MVTLHVASVTRERETTKSLGLAKGFPVKRPSLWSFLATVTIIWGAVAVAVLIVPVAIAAPSVLASAFSTSGWAVTTITMGTVVATPLVLIIFVRSFPTFSIYGMEEEAEQETAEEFARQSTKAPISNEARRPM